MGRLFGTNGVRGIANKEMTPELALRLGKAAGTYLFGKRRLAAPKIIIGTDTRTSKDMVKCAAVSGLLSTGCDVYDAGIITSPGLQYATREVKMNMGIIITASHNPPEFNGIKCVDADGTELSPEQENEIEEIYFSGKFHAAPWNEIGTIYYKPDAVQAYIDAVVSKVDTKAIAAKKPKVVVDASNGAGCFTAPYILRRIGCEVITLNCQPDGTFPGHQSEPVKENVLDLMNAVKAAGADFGIVNDGDADRAVFIDEKGDYVTQDRELTLFAKLAAKEAANAELKAQHSGIGNQACESRITRNFRRKIPSKCCQRQHAANREPRNLVVVAPVAVSMSTEDAVKQYGGKIVYTAIGSPKVARKMIELNAVFGGEANGGLIFPEMQYCRDGGMAAAKMAEIIAKSGRKLSEMVAELPQWHMVQTKTKCPNELKARVMNEYARAAKRLKPEAMDTQDGTKLYFKNGWVMTRPSGTEPIYRIYAESKDGQTAEKLLSEHVGIIRKLVEKFER